MPDGVETLADAGDLARLQPLDVTLGPPGEQLKVIEILAPALRGRALFVDTVFNAWNTLRRNLVKGAIGELMRDHPRELEAALGVVNDNLTRYALASLARGAAGIFLSAPASAESVTREQYERFMRPFDLALLEAVSGRGEFHVLHAHGRQLYFERLLDYPVHAINWGDRDGGPSLAEARRRTPLPLVGGIDHARFHELSASSLRAEIRDAVAEASRERLLLSPGCSVVTYAFPDLIRVARDAAARV
jgi:uroporphyrinogen decarboxylase